MEVEQSFLIVMKLLNVKRKLLMSDVDISNMWNKCSHNISSNFEDTIENLVIARQNFLKYYSDGIKLAKEGYKDGAPAWYLNHTSLGELRKRVKDAIKSRKIP